MLLMDLPLQYTLAGLHSTEGDKGIKDVGMQRHLRGSQSVQALCLRPQPSHIVNLERNLRA